MASQPIRQKGKRMGLFKSPEQKQAEYQQKLNNVMAKYGLQDVSPEYAPAVLDIARSLMGSGLIDFGSLLSNDLNGTVRAQTQYVHAIMEQNFIIIRELDRLIQLLEQK